MGPDPSAWGPHKKRKFRHAERHQGFIHREERPCEDMVRRWPSASHTERPQDKPSLPHLDLGLPASATVRNKFLLFEPPSLWSCVMAARAHEDVLQFWKCISTNWLCWQNRGPSKRPYPHPWNLRVCHRCGTRAFAAVIKLRLLR